MRNKRNNGFTLAELLIVVAIVGVLAAIATTVFSSQLEKSREATDIANLRSAKAAAVAKYLADDLNSGTYYFDAQKGVLVSEDNFTANSISGYGKGTAKNGATSNSFELSAIANDAITMSWVNIDGASNESTANYASNSDVSGQIIKITFGNSGNSGGAACVHTYDKYVSNNDGTHQVLCSKCDEVIITNETCNYVSGTCDKCNYDDPNASNEPITGSCATFTDGKVLSWEELKLTSNGSKYGYTASKITDTKIENAFERCSTLVTIQLPNTITTIGDYAFSNCTSLTTANIPDSVTSIGKAAFNNCSALTIDVNIPVGVTEIKSSTFRNTNITSVNIPNSVETIGDISGTNVDGVFEGCSNLTNVTIANGVKTIGYKTFGNCSNLSEIELPDSVTTIGNYVFYGCSSLTNIIIPAVNNSLYYDVGLNTCSQLTDIIFKGTVDDWRAIPTSAWNMSNITSNLTIHCTDVCLDKNSSAIDCAEHPRAKVVVATFSDGGELSWDELKDTANGTKYRYQASQITNTSLSYHPGNGGTFKNCTNLTSIKIPAGITTIEKEAFYDCNNLTSVIIPSGVTSIGNNAFYLCTNLTSVTMPASVTNLGSYVFGNCSKLTDITYSGTKAEWNAIAEGTSWNYNIDNYTIHCTDGDINKSDQPGAAFADGKYLLWSELKDNSKGNKYGYTASKITDTSISNAFSGCSQLISINLPDSITSFDSYAFNSCSGMTSIIIPDTITSIGDYAFQNCTGLTSVTIGNGVTSIGRNAFYKCTNLSSVNIGSNVNNINSYAFTESSNISSFNVDVNNSTYSSENGILFDKSKTTLVRYPTARSGAYTIPDNVTALGDNAFDSCLGLTSITIPSSITSTSSGAFNNCTNLISVDIPVSVTSLGGWTFCKCGKLKDINYAGTQAQWNAISKGTSWNLYANSYTVHYAN